MPRLKTPAPTPAELPLKALAPWQLQDATSPALFQAAAGAVESTMDAGKVNTVEEGWKDLKSAVVQKRLPGEPVM